MIYALDTIVVSELRRKRPHGGVLAWYLAQKPENVVVPAVVAGEIQQGVERSRLTDPSKAMEIEAWLNTILKQFIFVSADESIFRMQVMLKEARRTLQYEDALIAATAKVYGMVIATRNVKDFEGLGIPIVNPFDYR